MSLLVPVRRVLARRPWLYWVVVAGAAALAASVVAGRLEAVESTRRTWGTTTQVVVATADLAPGEPVWPASATRSMPVAVVPDGALETVDVDAVARQRIGVGEVVVGHDVAGPGVRARIPTGWLAVSIPLAETLGAEPGDPVTVASGGIVLATHGLVVNRSPEAVVVAVPGAQAPAVAAAVTNGDVSVLLEP